eukprot:CAMPEP_0182560090 /NCGR_PEP_ID=MMETSP1324-20130603/2945_1 /TAXON_ID=236786 /ORGANISM="Florenciella sp., Strain RCC1587" /LENGTH=39 /DNA_ID= /DNA_START= /DNA_END= /DNA_ORIENTATION=
MADRWEAQPSHQPHRREPMAADVAMVLAVMPMVAGSHRR